MSIKMMKNAVIFSLNLGKRNALRNSRSGANMNSQRVPLETSIFRKILDGWSNVDSKVYEQANVSSISIYLKSQLSKEQYDQVLSLYLLKFRRKGGGAKTAPNISNNIA